MAKLNRYDAKIFAGNAPSTERTAFKTAKEATPTYVTTPDQVQNNAYELGWIDASNATPYAEDMNGVMFAQSYLTKYLYEMGMPEWSSTATYYTNSYCQTGGNLYISLTDNNIGNDPTSDTTNWQRIDTTPVTASNLGTAYGIYKEKILSDLKFKGLSVTGNGSISATDDTITITIGGGSTGTVYWQNLPKNSTDSTTIGTALATKQPLLSYTPEDSANKTTSVRDESLANDIKYPTEKATRTAINTSVGNLANSLATVATTGSYNDLSNTPTIPTVNNGTLTIQKNGTTIDTFSANSSTNKTVNVVVPTKTSSLTNDSNFVASTSLATVATSGSYTDLSNRPSFATVATSGSYNDLSNKPTIPTVNNATLTIQKNGATVDTFTANASVDKTINISVPTNTNQLTNGSGYITNNIGSSSFTCGAISASGDISVGGNLTITGTTTTNNQLTANALISTNHIRPNASDSYGIGTAGNYYKQCYAVKWNDVSDRRLKYDIEDATHGLNEVLQLRPVTFKLTEDEANRINGGFIAQEVEGIIPEAVTVPENPETEYYFIDTTAIVASLTKAIQELNAKVESLEDRIEALEG